MKNQFLILFAILLIISTGCQKDDVTNPVESKEFTFNFATDTEGWTGDFTDYPNESNVDKFYEFEFSYSTLPSPLNNSEGALKQSGNNHSDDLFMFIKKKITGLEPNTIYKVDLEVEFATNAPNGSVGVGGAPGEGVFIKAGASTIEPTKLLDNSTNYFRMNIDKGNQAQDGSDMKLIGNFANGTTMSIYKLKILRTKTPLSVSSNSNGEIWVIVGTDSGHESTTTIYYNQIKVKAE